MTASHKDEGYNIPSAHGTAGHGVQEGPARGTGTTGLTGTAAGGGHTGTTSTGGSSGFSRDAKILGQNVKDKISGHGSKGPSTST